MKTVSDILTNKTRNSISIDKDSMVIDAFTLMQTENLDYAIVLENDNCIGIMSEVDYMRKIILARRNPKTTKAKEIMTSSICAVDVNEPIHKCLVLMDTFKIKHLLVFVDFLFRDVISLHDLLQVSSDENIGYLLELDEAKYILSSNFSATSYIS